ncbi:hypothetical protein [Lacrimispora saccharolytica]|uniref:MORN repeat-containing protein n=1 Tax=Lacrimispora saccharolytica (strain ATCC 35040 / DSM 2544 / NRCC 2533 / WM1) TaxID=610130 RepID=D9R6V2_LACSW|nr:hypothetical protein [Lacrimispora saccharolytica]ADL03608.1 hypothetical protein Closa_0990 [[Clostridium] saccharolyticum WM1]QRV18249.1 hypothetical protein I6K70_11825 [Lacrimispora saccharolytica]
MSENWKDQKRKENLRIILWIGLITLLLLMLSIAGTIRNGNKYEEPAGDFTEVGKAEPKALAEPLEETSSDEIILTSGDEEFLKRLTELFEQGDLEGAARVLSSYEIPWKDFPCIYDGTTMKGKISSGKGLVFIKASTVFYGNFISGKPEGECAALQVLELEEGKRYDYSYGTWEKGKMNGTGECGYHYYDGVTEGIAKLNSKRGAFQDDLMQGEITYTSTNSEGESAVWQFQVANGIIVKDDRWMKDTDDSGAVIYKLMAKGAEIHAYALGESAIGEDRWKNLLVFPQA